MRDKLGRFTKGNAGGPGRPTRRAEEEYLATMCEAVSLADWKKIVSKAVEDAKDGDGKARDWLGRYLIGDRQTDDSRRAVAKNVGAKRRAERNRSTAFLDEWKLVHGHELRQRTSSDLEPSRRNMGESRGREDSG